MEEDHRKDLEDKKQVEEKVLTKLNHTVETKALVETEVLDI